MVLTVTNIEQGGTGAKGILTDTAGGAGGLQSTITNGFETFTVSDVILTPVGGTVVGNTFAFEGFTWCLLGSEQ